MGRRGIERKHSKRDRITITFRVNAHIDAGTRFLDSISVECLFSMTPRAYRRAEEEQEEEEEEEDEIQRRSSACPQ
jgi:hypothetical protein